MAILMHDERQQELICMPPNEYKKLKESNREMREALEGVGNLICENPIREEVKPTRYKEEWKVHDCGECRACKVRKALKKARGES